MTKKQALEIMNSRGCDYYDHTDRDLPNWQAGLENSTVNTYKFVDENIAINKMQYLTAIKKYVDGTIYSWIERHTA